VKRSTLAAAIGAAALALALLPTVSASATPTTYYINNVSGSGCSDSGTGTSTATPWCSFTPANAHGAYSAGDRILLARGATFASGLVLTGSGTASAPIELGAYGTGAMPIVSGTGLSTERDVRINNGDYWLVDNLSLKNAGDGLLAFYSTTGHQGLTIQNMVVSGITGIHQGNSGAGHPDGIWNSAGITVSGVLPTGYTASQYMISGVTISGVEGFHNQSSLSFDWNNGETASGAQGYNNAQNVTLDHLNFHDDNGNGTSAGCDEGMRIVGSQNVVVSDSILNNEGDCHSNSGTADILIGRVKNVTFQNNIFENMTNTSSPDQVAIDYEDIEINTTFIDNVITTHPGAGISYLNIHSDNVITGAVSAGNTFVSNGSGSHRELNVPSTPTGTIRDNLYSEPNNFLFVDGSGSYAGFTVTNNQSATSAADVFPASQQFSSTQGGSNWSYQYLNGSTWTNLGYYDSTANVWQQSSSVNVPQVGRFDQHPGIGGTQQAARVWTAPHDGVVNVRGLVFKADRTGGDGVLASITKNGTQVWPVTGGAQAVAYNNLSGYETNLDQLAVTAGDVIRFQVTPGSSGDNTYDQTSWAPSIAYAGREFPTAGDTQGWTALNQASVASSGGTLNITESGSDPYTGSPNNLLIDASIYKHLQVRLKNTATGTLDLFFQTTADSAWSAAELVSTSVPSSSGYVTYTVNMGSNTNWAGTIKSLRLDPPGGSGDTASLDFVRIAR
jgi:hypothetical protein